VVELETTEHQIDGHGGGTGSDEDAGQSVEHSVLREALKHGVFLHNDDEARIRPVQRKGLSSAEFSEERVEPTINVLDVVYTGESAARDEVA